MTILAIAFIAIFAMPIMGVTYLISDCSEGSKVIGSLFFVIGIILWAFIGAQSL